MSETVSNPGGLRPKAGGLGALLSLGMLASFAMSGPVEAQGLSCARELTADVVALDQAVQFNRYGSHHPGYMIYALRDDVVGMNGGAALSAGQVRLRDDKRPRPLVLRMNAGDCLTVNFENLLNSRPISVPGISVDQPATRAAGLHVAGLNYVGSIADDGAAVGANAASTVPSGGKTTYRLHAPREGIFGMYNPASQSGGESNIGSLAFGMFGAVAVQPKGAEWYRSQVSRADLDLATEGTLPTGHPRINYGAVYPSGHPRAGRPILAILQGNRIMHGDTRAIITGPYLSAPVNDPNRGRFAEGSFVPNPVLEPNRNTEQGPEAGTRDRRDPYREFVLAFHDEVKSIQAFPQFEEAALGHTLHSVRDGFGINYGITGAGSQILANRFGLGPTAQCAECKYEEFFLTAWAGGDPALVVDVPANAQLGSDNQSRAPDAPISTRALYPDDPSNTFGSYLGDRVMLRNLSFGKEAHIFHLHAHQWLYNPEQEGSAYLDSQLIAPGSGYTYEIAFNGSGNRNQTVGDSIFHCHLYPHFAQGMWGLWRVHDVFEQGTKLDASGRVDQNFSQAEGNRALPDGEIKAGTAIPAIVPMPTMALAPLPAPVHVDAATGKVEMAAGSTAADNPGFPFFIPGQAGHRPPRPPLDTIFNGGLRRHVVTGGEGVAQLTRHDLDKVSDQLEIRWLAEDGVPSELAAMAYHSLRTHTSVTPEGKTRSFITNGRPPVRGAPFADPCVLDDGQAVPGADTPRVYKGAAFQMRLKLNRAGWHYPQGRLLALWNDVQATIGGTRAPEPLVMRANSGECIEYHHANLIESVSSLDDYQVRTPTDIVGQHIHLVKFDVTSADGSSNGWNYEDGTMGPTEVRERVHAIRKRYACAEAAEGGNCPVARAHPFFGEGPNGAWVGAQATVQRWYADPVTTQSGKDNTLRTVFTHDHFGPSTHQQNGLYGALVIAPKGTTWAHPETGRAINNAARGDGGPTSWMASVITPNPAESYREFVMQVADFASAYQAGGGMDTGGAMIPDPSRVINPPYRKRIGLPYLQELPNTCPGGGAPPCPEAVSAADTGTFVVNYRNEPLALRLYDPNAPRADGSGKGAQATGKAGDPAYAFRSDVTRAMPEFNAQPTDLPDLTKGLQAGDPWTPMLRTYRRDRVQVRMMVGAHEEPHPVHMSGMRWLMNNTDPNSGWRSSHMQAISEHFEFEVPVVAPEGDIGPHTDHLYSVSASAEGYWHGVWGLLRAYEYARNDLKALPNNTPPTNPRNQQLSDGQVVQLGVTGNVKNLPNFNGVCPVGAPMRRYAVSAVAASQAIGAQGIVYNKETGNYAAQRGPITDPSGAMYVLDSDLTAGKLKAGVPVEPLMLRAAAGDCIEVTLTNRLPANWADQVVAPANQGFYMLPMVVQRFNANQLKPSMEVGLNPQLLATDVTRNDGLNVGLNRVPPNAVRPVKQTVPPGQSTTYRWYAGLLTLTSANDLVATPVEFGALNLMPSDKLRHSSKGLIAGMVVLPQGATWVTDTATRMAATVTLPGGRQFRDFTLMFQDDLNLRASGKPVCPVGAGEAATPEEEGGTPRSITETGCKGIQDSIDAGNMAVNYRAEPFWFRLGHPPGENPEITRRLNFANVLSNTQVGRDPQTPVFTTKAGQEIRFRLLQAGGHGRSGVFNLHGHNWSILPYTSGTVPSQRIEGRRADAAYRPSPATGTRDAIGPGMHYNIVVEQAGGPAKVVGDYLFRNQMPDAFDSGVWGILRVTP
ncbi:cupredoxin domain-containing protein [Roseomonas marmotae]|uniref:Copper oxidase n=1 Tax=Roseomonas marmotae TaxID=2768161 RepID=A0ABS3KDL2_9PROT|nr:hypothetical protein [Roseomonas marmotae]MBO1075020.1 copper oxidase [Roseomonas marmotae]QTI79944.1 copper oxidase [Roseomonas marmotae]